MRRHYDVIIMFTHALNMGKTETHWSHLLIQKTSWRYCLHDASKRWVIMASVNYIQQSLCSIGLLKPDSLTQICLVTSVEKDARGHMAWDSHKDLNYPYESSHGVSCYLVLLSVHSKTSHTSMTPPIWIFEVFMIYIYIYILIWSNGLFSGSPTICWCDILILSLVTPWCRNNHMVSICEFTQYMADSRFGW